MEQKIQQLRIKEEQALKDKDIPLAVITREQRLELELQEVRGLKSTDSRPKLFNPANHSEIKSISMERVGLDYIPLIKGAYNVLAGRGGSGKSAVALKSMLKWLNLNKNKTAVAFFTEDGIEEIRNRTHIICRNSNMPMDLIDRIFFISLDNDDRIKWVSTSRDGYIVNDEYISDLIKFCKDNKAEYIILDPLKRFHRLSENSNDDMDVLVRDCFTKLASETNSVLLVLHHSAKNAEGGARGASTITDSARMAWKIGRYYVKDNESGEIKENEEKKHKVKLEVIKDNMGIEHQCVIRSTDDKSIFNPLKGSDINLNAPVETVYEMSEEIKKTDNDINLNDDVVSMFN